MSDDRRPRSTWWVLPALVCGLRAVPFLLLRVTTPDDPRFAYLPVGYLPKDFLQYVALLRQVPDQGAWAFANPFTTEPQDGRLILPLMLALGWVSRLTGLDPFWTLELARVPLVFAFFWVLRRFCRLVHVDAGDRRWAYWLVGLSGGVEVLAKLGRSWLPEAVRGTVAQDLWHLQGWSTFAALFNPLWVAGLTLALLALEPVLRPEGPSRTRDLVQLTVALVALHWTHVYSEIVVLTVTVARPAVEWLLGAAPSWHRIRRTVMGVGIAMAVIVPVTLWQLRDPVFARASSGLLGTQHLPVFWYPLTLGLVGVFAIRGFQRLARAAHPWRFGLGAWALGVVFLHTSPVLNGYHFVFHLHLPLALVAAPAVAATVRRLREPRRAPVALAALLVGLFASSAAVTVEAIGDARRKNRSAIGYVEAARALGGLPPGNVLCPWTLGNLVPAYGPHRVWVGHWFLTPDYSARAQEYERLVNAPGPEEELRALVARERIRYVVASPAGGAPRLARTRAGRTTGTVRLSRSVVFVLADGAG